MVEIWEAMNLSRTLKKWLTDKQNEMLGDENK